MPFIREHKLIFQHIPKTAGMSICDFFGVEPSGHQHMNFYINQMTPQELIEYASFTVVRNPIDRFLSAWEMYQNPPPSVEFNEDFWIVRKEYEQLFSMDINDSLSLENLQTFWQDRKTFHFGSMMTFCCTIDDIENPEPRPVNFYKDKDKLKIKIPNIVLRFEDLENDFRLMADIIGFKFDKLPKKNRSVEKKGRAILTDASVEWLNKAYYADHMIIDAMLRESHVSNFLKKENS